MPTKQQIFAALEQLPPKLRHEINFSSLTFDACHVLQAYRYKSDVDWLVRSIRAGEAMDTVEFNRRYQLRYGHPWPAHAAGTTPLLYQPSKGVRAYKRRGGSAKLRAAWAASEGLLPA
jgi:hypothetical protein